MVGLEGIIRVESCSRRFADSIYRVPSGKECLAGGLSPRSTMTSKLSKCAIKICLPSRDTWKGEE